MQLWTTDPILVAFTGGFPSHFPAVTFITFESELFPRSGRMRQHPQGWSPVYSIRSSCLVTPSATIVHTGSALSLVSPLSSSPSAVVSLSCWTPWASPVFPGPSQADARLQPGQSNHLTKRTLFKHYWVNNTYCLHNLRRKLHSLPFNTFQPLSNLKVVV